MPYNISNMLRRLLNCISNTVSPSAHKLSWNSQELTILGPIVRINPNEVHINDAEFHMKFSQKYRDLRKDPWYYNMGAPGAVFLTTDRAKHKARRDELSPYLNVKMAQEIPEVIRRKVDQLCSILRISREQNLELNLSDAFRSLGHDIVTPPLLGNYEELLGQEDLGHNFLPNRELFRLASISRMFPRTAIYLPYFIPKWVSERHVPILRFGYVSTF
jgi:hypothetical protein